MPLRAQSAKGAREAGATWVRGMAQAQDKSNPWVAAWRHTGRTGYGGGMEWRERKVQSARGQGNRRTLMAGAFSRAFKAQGYVCGMYYQMD